MATPNGKRASFYALSVPEGSPLPPTGLVFHDLKEILAAVKQIKGSRFKEFTDESEAVAYSQSNVSILDTSAVMSNESEKSSVAPFKSLAPRELAPFRRLIESGKVEGSQGEDLVESQVLNIYWRYCCHTHGRT